MHFNFVNRTTCILQSTIHKHFGHISVYKQYTFSRPSYAVLRHLWVFWHTSYFWNQAWRLIHVRRLIHVWRLIHVRRLIYVRRLIHVHVWPCQKPLWTVFTLVLACSDWTVHMEKFTNSLNRTKVNPLYTDRNYCYLGWCWHDQNHIYMLL